MRIIEISSIDALRAAAPAWDDLWWRSDVTLPTLRAELIAQWAEHFASPGAFRALAVEDEGQWVAALPLVRRRLGRLLPTAALPTNPWSCRGEMLLDCDADVDAVLDRLLAALQGLPEPLMWLESVAVGARHWEALRQAAERAGVPMDLRVQYQVGRIEIDHDWQCARCRWSRRHRQQMARHMRRLARGGQVRCRVLDRLAPEEVESWMRRGLDVEDRGWKGAAGTAVLRQPWVLDYFVRQAEQLARWNALQLSFLESGEQTIAFNYAMTAKGVCHSCKGGYDPAFAEYSPGQLLRHGILERLHAEPGCRALDCIGPLTDAHRSWKPTVYAVGRVAIATRRVGRMALHAYRRVWPYLRRWRGGASSTPMEPQQRGAGARETGCQIARAD